MDLIIKNFVVNAKEKVNLKDHDAGFTGDLVKADEADQLDKLKEELNRLQEKLYASNKQALLLIFQAMDAAGKDSVISHVMSGLNPQGCQVFSFKQPSAEDYDHDFLWRHYRALPEKGRIGIHNRSHYENVLVCKVHPEYILKEKLAGIESVSNIDDDFWDNRYESICNFEKHLAHNGTVVIKFFLNVSKEKQKERFLERIEDPAKNWKFSAGDVEERRHWDKYMKAYETAISKTSFGHAPWYIIPADKKWFTRIAVCKIIVETLTLMDLKFPQLSADEAAGLESCKKTLMAE